MNIKKRFSGLFIITAAILLFITGCANPLMPLHEEDSGTPEMGASGAQGLLSVTVGDDASSRTILPTIPSFTKYRLEFSGPGSVDPVESTEASFDAVYLDPGEWTVTAYGYAMFGGSEEAVAEGSGTVTVSAGSTDTLALTITAQQTGGTPGTFEYSLSVPEAFNGMIDTYDVSYHPYGDSSSPVSDSGAVSYSGSGFSYSGSADIEPGYYLATVQVSSSDYSATKMEIVHIYSNMVSSGSFDFTESDIMPVATLSGTLEILNMGVAQDESGWTVEAYTSADYSADSIIGEAVTDGSSNWSMDVEAQDPATEIYFRANGNDDSSDFYDRPVVADLAVILGTSDVTDIALSENLGQVTVSGTLSYTADGTPGVDLQDWEIIPYFDNGNYYEVWYDSSTTTDASGNWSFTIDEAAINPVEPLGFTISKWDAGADFYDGSAITVEYSDITQDLSLELITLSGDLTQTIDGVTVTDFSEYDISVSSGYDDYYGKFGNCTAEGSGAWSMLVPATAESRELYFTLSSYANSYEKSLTTSSGTISNSAVTGLTIALGDSVTAEGTVEVIINEVTQDLTEWNWSYLYFYTSPDYTSESQIGWIHIEALTGTAEAWSVVLPAQDPAADIYVAFSGSDSSMEYYNYLDAGSFTLGTSPLTGQALTVEQGIVTISGTLSGTMNGSALTIAENEWTVQLRQDGGWESFSALVGTDGTWEISIPESETSVIYNYSAMSNTQGYNSSDPSGSVSVSNSDIGGLSIELNLVQISGTLEVTIEDVTQDLSAWNYYSLQMTDDQYSSFYAATVTAGSPATWIAAIDTQDPATDFYASFYGQDGSSNQYNGLDAGVISSVGTSEITGQVLSVDSSSITISGTMQLEVNGSSMSPDEDDWIIVLFEDLELENSVGDCSVATDGTWSVDIESYTAETELYYLIQGNSYGYVSLPTAADSITVYDSDVTGQTISLDIVEISGTLTAGTDTAGFDSHTGWGCIANQDESLLLLLAFQGTATGITDGNWTTYVDAAESGTVEYTVGFIGTTATNPYGTLYQTTVSVGQTAVTGVSAEFSELEYWGCSVSGTFSAGTTGADFSDGYSFYMCDNSEMIQTGIVGFGLIAPDGTFTAQLYEDSSAYDVWFYVQGNYSGLSDAPILLGGGDSSGLSLSLDDFSSY